MMESEEGPLSLTMPIPLSPLGVDTAEIVSFTLANFNLFRLYAELKIGWGDCLSILL